ncbi:hypothetical protein AURDEDRAFT_130179 [Auricularia subglabra TFB-10046 SS5]|nr:hypothetical protein AURDEDRAFT_130179 [Auricularia subglabra TFB-10046 SS5]
MFSNRFTNYQSAAPRVWSCILCFGTGTQRTFDCRSKLCRHYTGNMHNIPYEYVTPIVDGTEQMDLLVRDALERGRELGLQEARSVKLCDVCGDELADGNKAEDANGPPYTQKIKSLSPSPAPAPSTSALGQRARTTMDDVLTNKSPSRVPPATKKVRKNPVKSKLDDEEYAVVEKKAERSHGVVIIRRAEPELSPELGAPEFESEESDGDDDEGPRRKSGRVRRYDSDYEVPESPLFGASARHAKKDIKGKGRADAIAVPAAAAIVPASAPASAPSPAPASVAPVASATAAPAAAMYAGAFVTEAEVRAVQVRPSAHYCDEIYAKMYDPDRIRTCPKFPNAYEGRPAVAPLFIRKLMHDETRLTRLVMMFDIATPWLLRKDLCTNCATRGEDCTGHTYRSCPRTGQQNVLRARVAFDDAMVTYAEVKNKPHWVVAVNRNSVCFRCFFPLLRELHGENCQYPDIVPQLLFMMYMNQRAAMASAPELPEMDDDTTFAQYWSMLKIADGEGFPNVMKYFMWSAVFLGIDILGIP